MCNGPRPQWLFITRLIAVEELGVSRTDFSSKALRRGDMIFELGQRDHHVGVLISLVQVQVENM